MQGLFPYVSQSAGSYVEQISLPTCAFLYPKGAPTAASINWGWRKGIVFKECFAWVLERHHLPLRELPTRFFWLTLNSGRFFLFFKQFRNLQNLFSGCRGGMKCTHRKQPPLFQTSFNWGKKDRLHPESIPELKAFHLNSELCLWNASRAPYAVFILSALGERRHPRAMKAKYTKACEAELQVWALK